MTERERQPDPERLDRIEEEIEQVRRRLAQEAGEAERRFIDPGGGPEDNTIVPPG